MSDQIKGVLEIQDTGGTATHITLSGDSGEIDAGGNGANGGVVLKDDQGNPRLHIGRVLGGTPPAQSWVWEISVLDASGTKIVTLGPTGDLTLGAKNTGGDLFVRGQNGKDRIRIRGNTGYVELRDDQGVKRVQLGAEDLISVHQDAQHRAGYFLVDAPKNTVPALEGRHNGSGAGVTGTSKDADGVYGASGGTYKSGVYGSASDLTGYGVSGRNANFNCFGALGARPVEDEKPTAYGVWGWAQTAQEDVGTDKPTKWAIGARGYGFASGVDSWSEQDIGVFAGSDHSVGLYARSNDGAFNPDLPDALAGHFEGSVNVWGNLWALAKNCKIDHPLDPANKYLVHACVESSERLNVYRGSATMNSKGEATVRLPNWTEAFNGEFDYQLTPIGGSAPDLHIGEEIKDGRFRIAGGKPKQRVSWQVTGARVDAYAKAHPLRVEVPKRAADRGKYLTPIEHGKSEKQRMRLREIAPTRRRTGRKSSASSLRKAGQVDPVH
jgi:hypothetical protein